MQIKLLIELNPSENKKIIEKEGKIVQCASKVVKNSIFKSFKLV